MRWKDHFSKRTNIRLNRYLAKNTDCIPAIVASNLTVEAAKDLEIRLIAEIGRQDIGTGPLYNLTSGGDGTSGRTMSKDQKAEIKAKALIRWGDSNQRTNHSVIS